MGISLPLELCSDAFGQMSVFSEAILGRVLAAANCPRDLVRMDFAVGFGDEESTAGESVDSLICPCFGPLCRLV